MVEKDKTGKENSTSSMTSTETVKVQRPVSALSKYSGKYILKPCKNTWLSSLDKSHDGAVLFSEAKLYLAPERHKNTGLINTGLTTEEARELELEMNLKPMELSPYSNFWSNFKIYPQVPKEGLILDLDRSALDKLRFIYCKVHSKVAQSYSDVLENPQAEAVLTSAEKEAVSTSVKIRIKLDAVRRFGEMSITDQINFLKVFEEGKFQVSKSSTPDFIMGVLGKIVDEKPQDFLDTANNPDFKTMAFLQDCVLAGIIKKSGPKYYVTGGELIGNTFLDTIANLQSPDYNEVKISLKAKLDSIK